MQINVFQTILERLNAGKLLIGDGGYITEMERRGYVKAGAWTPEVTVEHPETGSNITFNSKQFLFDLTFQWFKPKLPLP